MRSPEVRQKIAKEVTKSHRERQSKIINDPSLCYKKNEPVGRKFGREVVKNKGIYNVSKLEFKIIQLINEMGIPCKPSYMPKEINYIYDGYIPQFKTLIEVDGKYWHSEEIKRKSYNLTAETKKTNLAQAAGYHLIRFREKDLPRKDEDLKKYIEIVLSNNQIYSNVST